MGVSRPVFSKAGGPQLVPVEATVGELRFHRAGGGSWPVQTYLTAQDGFNEAIRLNTSDYHPELGMYGHWSVVPRRVTRWVRP